MSVIHFMVLPDSTLAKTEYKYKDILPEISASDVLYSAGISFHKELSPAEKSVWKDLDLHWTSATVYAVHTGYKLDYNPDYKRIISEDWARNSLNEIRWLLSLIKKLLNKNDSVFIITTSLGLVKTDSVIKTCYIDVNDFAISEDKKFKFQCDVLYQFVDNSEEAIEREKRLFGNK